MITAPIPENEPERLEKLRELAILDTLEENAYDDLTALAAHICQTPIALVSLIDADRQWFKSHHGLAARETPRELAFCAHAILGDKLLLVEDSARDMRFYDNPVVVGAPFVKFYAGAPLIYEPGIRLGTLCVVDDHPRELTTEQRHALEALARQVVTQLKLRQRLKQLEQLDKAKDDFIAMVSHELRTPLTAINGALGILHSQLSATAMPQQAGLVDIAHRNSDRLITIVNDILDAAKLQSGRVELHKGRVDATFIATQAAELNRSYCDKLGCELHLNVNCSGGCVVLADPVRTQQVLANLISNAAKFSPKGQTVELTLTGDDRNVRFTVTDRGPGIPQEQRHRLFQRFSQLSPDANTKTPGTGLGLHISKQLVELQGGTIGLDCEPGVHTSFYFTLPRAPT